MEYKRDMLLSIYPPIMFYNKNDISRIWEESKEAIEPHYISLYLHIPFCPRKCDYCFLVSEVAGLPKMELYVDKLIEEIQTVSEKTYLKNAIVRSVVIGGGTPTLLPTNLLAKLFETLYQCFNIIREETEIAVEMHPGKEVTDEKLKLLKEYGITRVSIGVESFDEDILKLNGRNCTAEETIRTLGKLSNEGFDYINIDIISGLLGETQKSWNYTLTKLIEMQPQEVTLYKLQLYENSMITNKCKKMGLKIMDDSTELAFTKQFYEFLFSNEYKLSTGTYSFCRNDLQHKYRMDRNHGVDLVALGVAANGVIGKFVYQNEISLDKYLKEESHITSAYCMTEEDLFYRAVVLGLRTGKIDIQEIIRQHGISPLERFYKELEVLQKEKYMSVTENCIEFIDDGIYFADDIIRKNFMPKNVSKMEEMMLKYRNYDFTKTLNKNKK